MNKTKRSLSLSVLAIVLSIAMLIGTTFAWFTDSVTSGGNIIKSGELDIEMYWTDDLASNTWYNVDDPAHNVIFQYDKWEPGYTQVRYIKIVNGGNLALNYNLTIHPEGEVGKLAEVINVFSSENAVTLNSAADLSTLNSQGLLSTVLEKDAVLSGTLLAEGQTGLSHKSGETVVTIAMNMLTTAGNEYQGETAGSFSVTALASQCVFEEDSFDSSYDTYAEMPKVLRPGRASAEVTVADGKTTAAVTMTGDDVSATVPAGVAVKNGVEKLELKVTPLKSSTAGVTVVENEVLIPVDVHIEGIAEGNTTPIIIEVKEKMPKNLNLGNYKLIHVEDGVNKVMTYVEPTEELTAHNQYKYDPLTGTITLAMASFSEVTMLAATDNPWRGEVADFKGEGTEANPYVIANADQLAKMSQLVSTNNPAYCGEDVYFELDANINMGGAEAKDAEDNDIDFYPIGYWNKVDEKAGNRDYYYDKGGEFCGTFNGKGHIVSGIYQETWDMEGNYDNGYWKAAMGLFGTVNNATIKYLTINNFQSVGEFAVTGCVAARAAGTCNFQNITITNSNPATYNTSVAAVVGRDTTGTSTLNFENITVDKTNKITALWGSWDVGCAGILGYLGENGRANLTNCHVAANIDVFNDVCGNYQYYWYRYCGMFVGTVDKTNANGVLDLSNITAANCTTNFEATDHDYYYCELVANTKASYTHDHQFSRLTPITSLDKIYDSENDKWLKSGNYLFDNNGTKECYHIVKDGDGFKRHQHSDEGTETINGETVAVEDKVLVNIPFAQLFGGYGWGVDGVDEYENIELNSTDSVSKFTHTPGFVQNPADGEEVKLSEIFSELNAETAVDSAVYVTVDKVNPEDSAKAVFTADSTNWENGTIKFSGEGQLVLTIQDYNKCIPYSVYVYVGGIDDGSGDDEIDEA